MIHTKHKTRIRNLNQCHNQLSEYHLYTSGRQRFDSSKCLALKCYTSDTKCNNPVSGKEHYSSHYKCGKQMQQLRTHVYPHWSTRDKPWISPILCKTILIWPQLTISYKFRPAVGWKLSTFLVFGPILRTQSHIITATESPVLILVQKKGKTSKSKTEKEEGGPVFDICD